MREVQSNPLLLWLCYGMRMCECAFSVLHLMYITLYGILNLNFDGLRLHSDQTTSVSVFLSGFAHCCKLNRIG